MKNKDVKSHSQLNVLLVSVLSFIIVLISMFLLYFVKGFAPFGDRSLVWADAYNDYIDFFAYLRDVLFGESSLGFSFTKGLGGNMFGVITTGYFSPFNLIIVFFDKAHLNSFFDVVVAAKLAMAAFTMSVFLKKRLPDLRVFYTVALSVGYGLCQYNIAQSSNIFFLEGMYMLPLFMLGTYYIVKKDSPFLLIFCVAYSIAFGWYSGAFNCIFTVFWALFEFLWQGIDKKQNIKDFLLTLKTFVFAALIGVLISLVVFLPTIISLQTSSEGTLNFELFKESNEYLGNAITVLTNYTWYSHSSFSAVSLFSGSLALIGCIAFFFSSQYRKKEKYLVGAFLGIVIMFYYWKPLYLLFSLFKPVRSFWSRYGYLGIFTIIFISALFFSEISKEKKAQKRIPAIALSFILVVLLYNKDTEAAGLKWIYATCLSVIFVAVLLYFVIPGDNKSRKKLFLQYLIVCFSIFEMSFNSHLLMNYYSNGDIQKNFIEYLEQGENQISSIKYKDKGYYRISQTSTRNMTEDNLTANYDEAAMLNYWSLESYTSVPDDNQREFLDKAGYKMHGEDLLTINTSIIPIDSILGVKYILSDYDIDGYELNESYGDFKGKKVYENPYALPMAFVIDHNISEDRIENAAFDKEDISTPFIYQNALISELAGKEVEVFTPVEFKKKEAKKAIKYNIEVPNGNYALYGNLPWTWAANEKLYVNGNFMTGYAMFKSPGVFYIPNKGGKVDVKVTTKKAFSIADEQFYVVDLDALKEVTSRLQDQTVDEAVIEDGYARFKIKSGKAQKLITSIPYDTHWMVTLNGKQVEPQLLGGCLMSVDLAEGDNIVEMQYKIGGIKEGLILTLFGLLLTVIWYVVKIYKRRKVKKIIDKEL
ncbi:MAG: YfhO family protein [Eubacterium sp.]|nr:YfhO family protein [Eubacterium sp.]